MGTRGRFRCLEAPEVQSSEGREDGEIHMMEQSLVCNRVHMGSDGMATEWFVRLPDGYLVSCGNHEHRANMLAKSIWLSAIPIEDWMRKIPL